MHLKNLSADQTTGDLADHLAALYDDGAVDRQALAAALPPISRFYIGDEFCPMRLPDPQTLSACCRYAQSRHAALTLLVPVLTDAWIKRCGALFDRLESWDPHAEVVVNDLGTLFYLQRRHAGFAIALGRIMNKGFKDPRLSVGDTDLNPVMANLLNESTFDNPILNTLLVRLSIGRLERDLMPHGDRIAEPDEERQTAYYFPFGYVTTGRGCLTTTFGNPQADRLWPHTRCTKPCDRLTLELENDQCPAKLVQAGNTVFYQYAPERLSALIEAAGQANHRLVYQGFAI